LTSYVHSFWKVNQFIGNKITLNMKIKLSRNIKLKHFPETEIMEQENTVLFMKLVVFGLEDSSRYIYIRFSRIVQITLSKSSHFTLKTVYHRSLHAHSFPQCWALFNFCLSKPQLDHVNYTANALHFMYFASCILHVWITKDVFLFQNTQNFASNWGAC